MENAQENSQGSSNTSSNASTSGGEATGWSSEQISAMQSELAESKKQISNLSKSAQTMDRIQKAFQPEETPQQDPDDAFLDHYLQQAIEAEKNGTPIPLTANLAVKLYEEKQRNKELARNMKSIADKVSAMENPAIVSDRQAFASIDANIENRLGSLFGEEGYAPQVFSAAANLIVEEINRLKAEEPDVWDRIKKNPKHQDSMVKHFVNKVIPAQARQSMQREAMESYTLSPQELLKAFREASDIEDPKVRDKVRQQVRQQLLSTMYSSKKDTSLSSKLSRMY